LQGSYSTTIRFKGCSAGKSSQYARECPPAGFVRDRPPHAGFQQRLGCQSVIEILFTVVGHDSGGFAMIGVFFLVTASVGFAASCHGGTTR